MDRALAANLIAKSGKAVEVAGDIDTLLLDKTGTITLGNRKATLFVPMGGTTDRDLARWRRWPRWPIPPPRARASSNWPAASTRMELEAPAGSRFVEFTAQTRMSGIDLPDGTRIRKGAPGYDRQDGRERGGSVPDGYQETVDAIASKGATPLAVTSGDDTRRPDQAR